MEDLAQWHTRGRKKNPRMSNYKRHEVYRLQQWSRAFPLLQESLNIPCGIFCPEGRL